MSTSSLAKLFASSDSLAGLVLRVPAGVIFVARGAQKLFGRFALDNLVYRRLAAA